jgi:hypothetical protein
MANVQASEWHREDVSGWAVRGVEQAGSTRNLWLEEPTTCKEWLHKNTLIPSNGVEQGEDWSEVISTRIAMLLGVPCATTRLCTFAARRGSISLSVRPAGHALNEGTVVMERAAVPGFVSHLEGSGGVDPARPQVYRPGHNLVNIRTALTGVAPPPDFGGPEETTAFDAFAGYMVLDALIANRDRHEQNWAVLTPQLASLPERLAPSYDHASSLGFNLTDNSRQAYLQQRTLSCGRGPRRAKRPASSIWESRGRWCRTPPKQSRCARHKVQTGGGHNSTTSTSNPCWSRCWSAPSQKCRIWPLPSCVTYLN